MPTHAPLAGTLVVEVGNFMAGPFCAMQLADLGADVVKVENPAGGDMVRQSPPMIAGESSSFMRLNRNKRSLALDLKRPEGKRIFLELAGRADVVVENLRPGTMAELELDYPRLQAINPDLIYVAASGWGQTGPYAPLAGLDIMAQAMSGLMSITGIPDGDPVKVGVPICDLVCGLYGALAAVTALRHRDATGVGQLIDVSLFESGVSLAVWEIGRFYGSGEVPRPQGSAHQSSAPYQAIRAQDQWFTVGATSPNTWRGFCVAMGLEELHDDPRFHTNPERMRNRTQLIQLIEAVTVTRPAAYWIARLQAEGVPCALIQDYRQVFSDPHLEARGYFWEGLHPLAGPVRQLGSPMRFERTPTRRDTAGPLLGQHTEQVLAELGLGPAEIAALLQSGVVATASTRA